jgi:prohibitin 2
MGRGGFDDDEKKYATICLVVTVLLVTAASLIGVSLNTLQSTEVGLEYDVHAKLLEETAKEGGLHAGPPGYKFVKFPSTYITTDVPDDLDDPEREGTCVSADGLRVQIAVSFQFQVPRAQLSELVRKYRDFKRWKKVVNAAAVSAIQKGCSLYEIGSFQAERGMIQESMTQALKYKLEGDPDDPDDTGVYALAVGLQLRNVMIPMEYSQAVAAKQEANEDVGLAINQRQQQVTLAETTLQTSLESARKINDTAIINKQLMIAEASLEAEGIGVQFNTEADIYSNVKTTLGLSTEGLLAYLGTRALDSTENDVKLTITEPAQASYKAEL